jgi:hypothetical protein
MTPTNFDLTRRTIPPYAKLQKNNNGIIWDGAPLFYRSNGATGNFINGCIEYGSTLYLQPIQWRWVNAARWSRKTQYWLDLLFIDKDQRVSIICFANNAAQAIAAWLKGLQSQPEYDLDPKAVWLQLELLPQVALVEGENEIFYVPEIKNWDWVDAEQYQLVSNWHCQHQPDLNESCWLLPGDVG